MDVRIVSGTCALCGTYKYSECGYHTWARAASPPSHGMQSITLSG